MKGVGLYQSYDKGGLRMPDLECIIKALRMAWIPRLLKEGHQNWKTVPDHFFKRYGGLEFIFGAVIAMLNFSKTCQTFTRISSYISVSLRHFIIMMIGVQQFYLIIRTF